ncbi:hypothetical protein K501DRAFT_230325 [Backusella circina FSU 941]|nr:hypothetical protein K501DRAFT_230325 [Backusella circina FSU 941]
MTTIVGMLPSKPIAIPQTNSNNPNTTTTSSSSSYKEIIKQLAAQTATKPYGDIPPMLKKKRKKREIRSKLIRRMSHVEDWIQVDSKESLPDEEELVQSPFRNFLSQDFITEVLPLHVPPPSLSELYYDDNNSANEQQADIFSDEEDEDLSSWKSDEEEELSSDLYHHHQDQLLRRRSISTFTSPSSPPLFTPLSAVSCAISSSPPHLSNTNHQVWQDTIQKLKKSLIVSSSPTTQKKNNKKKKLIPMPPAPRRPLLSKRRSEATTQPRFNPITNTYTRDTRSNPDHLLMISAELNMMRAKKLLSPLKPRGFLPRRKDAFVRGEHRKRSHLSIEW